jgi:hypothetical protein
MQSLRIIGYWEGEHEPGWPRVEDFVDVHWDADERQDVVFYLRHGMPVRFFMGMSSCRVCGMINGSEELTDGTFLWPEGLAHYVEDHGVRLPEEFVQHSQRMRDGFENAAVDLGWWGGLRGV